MASEPHFTANTKSKSKTESPSWAGRQEAWKGGDINENYQVIMVDKSKKYLKSIDGHSFPLTDLKTGQRKANILSVYKSGNTGRKALYYKFQTDPSTKNIRISK